MMKRAVLQNLFDIVKVQRLIRLAGHMLRLPEVTVANIAMNRKGLITEDLMHDVCRGSA